MMIANIFAFFAGLLGMGILTLIATMSVFVILIILYFMFLWCRKQIKAINFMEKWQKFVQFIKNRTIQTSAVYVVIVIFIALLPILMKFTELFSNGNSMYSLCKTYYSMIINVLGGIIGIVLVFALFKPNFSISDNLAIYPNNRLRVLITNKHWLVKLYNVKVEMAYYKYDEERKDEIICPIDMDSDDVVSVLYGQSQGPSMCTYAFHSRFGFLNNFLDYEGVRCRVSATQSVFGRINIHDKYYPFRGDSIRWGCFIGGQFIPQESYYTNVDKKEKYKLLNSYSVLMTKVLFPYSKIGNNLCDELNKAIGATQDLLVDSKYKSFNMQPYKTTIDMMEQYLRLLKNLYLTYVKLPPWIRDRRDRYVTLLNRNLVFITKQMENSI